jgi:hypothetical protein
MIIYQYYNSCLMVRASRVLHNPLKVHAIIPSQWLHF